MTPTGQIAANPDNLREVAQRISAVLPELEALAPLIDEIPDAARKQASIGTTDHQPAPFHSPLVTALGTSTGKINVGLAQIIENLTNDVKHLNSLADQFEGNEQANSTKIKGLGTPNAKA